VIIFETKSFIIIQLLENISYLSSLVPIFVFFFLFKKLKKEKQIWVILLYLLFSFISDSLILYEITPASTLAIRLQISIFSYIEYVLFSVYLALSINNQLVKSLIYVLIGLFTLFCGFYIYYNFYKGDFYSTIATIEAIVLIVLSIVGLYDLIKQPDLFFIYSSSQFWIIVAFLFFLAGTFFLTIILENLSKVEANKYWSINLIFNTLKNMLFAIAFFIHKKKFLIHSG